MPHEIIMPALGMAQDTGLLVAWHKQTGDPVEATDILMEVETDKTTLEVEAGVSGFVAELRVQAGEEVPVGGVVAVVCESPGELQAVSADEQADSGSASAARLAISPASAATAGTLVADSPVAGSPVMGSPVTDSPVAGSPVTGSLVTGSLVAPSNAVAPASSAADAGQAGRILASPKARRLARERGLDLQLLVRQGVAEPIHAADLENLSAAGQGRAPQPGQPRPPRLTQLRHTAIDLNPVGVVASPSTRRLAARADIDLEQLASELGQDCISRTDVENKLIDDKPGTNGMPTAGPSLLPWNIDHARYGPVEPLPVSRLNRFAAANLTAAAQRIPSVTHHDAADITDLEALRSSLKSEAAKRGTRLTMLAFLVKALSQLLDDHQTFNTSLSDDGNTLWQKRYTHIGIAVDTPHGLMIPVIRDADRKDIWAVAAEIADLGARAQTRKIRPDEAGGASMTITSLGSVGGRAFTPIINPPEVAIIGFTPAAMEPVWNGEVFEPRLMLPIDLSYDHRVINGADAARFVSDLAARLATPDVLTA